MKAAVVRGVEYIELLNLPDPAPAEDGIVLEVAACGVCGGDIRSYYNGHPFDNGIMGHEVTGIVVKIGGTVKSYNVGDKLALAADIHCGECPSCRRGYYNLCSNLKILGKHVAGGFAEYLSLSGEVLARGIVNRLPDSVTFTDGTFAEPMCSCLAAQDRLGIGIGQTVAVLGGGPIGCIHLTLAGLKGAFARILTEPSPERAAAARRMCLAEEIIDPASVDPVDQVMEYTHGQGADAAIVACPVPEAVGQAVRMVRPRGKVAVFGGMPKGRSEGVLDFNAIHYREIEVFGTFSYHPNYHKLALDLLASGRFDAGRFITTYALDDIEKAIVDARAGKILKGVLLMKVGD